MKKLFFTTFKCGHGRFERKSRTVSKKTTFFKDMNSSDNKLNELKKKDKIFQQYEDSS